ncbi:MAG: hypothetical protein WCR63_01690 [Bacilli bacterium]
MNLIDVVVIVACVAILVGLIIAKIRKPKPKHTNNIVCSGEYGCPAQPEFKRALKKAKKSIKTKE